MAKTKILGSQINLDSLTREVHALSSKTAPVDADEALLVDSAASYAAKRLSWSNIKATLKSYFDTLYAPTSKGVTNGDSHDHYGGDGAQISHGNLSNLDQDHHTQYLTQTRHDVAARHPISILPYVTSIGKPGSNSYLATAKAVRDALPAYAAVVGPYAWCDYVTDGSADNVEIQQAINDGKKMIVLLPGVYDIKSTIQVLTDGVWLMGAGSSGSPELNVVKLRGTAKLSPILQVGSNTQEIRSFQMSNITITRQNPSQSNLTVGLYIVRTPMHGLINIYNCMFCDSFWNVRLGNNDDNIENVAPTTFYGCSFGRYDGRDRVGVWQNRAADVRYISCIFQGYEGDLSAGLSAIGWTHNDAFISNCYFASFAKYLYNATPKYCILWANGIVLRVENTQFEEGGDANLVIQDGIDVGIYNCNLGGAYNLPACQIYMRPESGRDIRNVRIIGNSIGYYSGDRPISVSMYGSYRVKDLVIAHNNIMVRGLGCNIENVDRLVFSNNTMLLETSMSYSEMLRVYHSSARDAMNMITNNVIDDAGLSSNSFGIYCSPNTNRSIVMGNIVKMTGANKISVQGSNCVVDHNITF